MKIKNFTEVVEQIQVHLNSYLAEHNIDSSKMFKCINPAHPDRSPSCNTNGAEGKLFHCYGCGSSGDIFKAAYYLENKPLVGKEFITDNLLYLANKYGVTVESTPLTEDEIYELDTYRAYKFAAEYITNSKPTDSFKKSVDDHGWTNEICRAYSVGCTPSFKEFREHLKVLGFSASFLDDIDLGRKELFGDEVIIFTIKDEHGRPVGFSSRNLKYTDDKQNGSKYINTTGAKCSIYKKGTRLYGVDQLLKNHPKRSDPVYIFEGYGDVVTSAQHGVTNCVALGGTSFSVEQLQLLKDLGYYNLVLCLDGDEPGQERTAALLDTTLGGHKDVRIGIVIVPESLDPDDYIRKYGVTEFSNLKVWTAFEWRLLQFNSDTDTEVVCKNMIPLIVNESSSISQEKMIKVLSQQTGISIKAIQQDVALLQNSREAEKARARQNILDKMIRSLQKNPTEAELAMHEANSGLYELNRRFNEDAFSEESCLQFLDQQKELDEKKDGKYSGFLLGDDLKQLEEALYGEWKEDVWFCFGGKANTGKTSLMSKIGFEIARHTENDAMVIYHTIDDTAKQLMPKLICVAEGSRKLTINQVRDPKFHCGNNKSALARRETGYTMLRDLMKDGRIIIKDANDGSSLAYADMLITYYKTKYPERKVVYILDNFHKLQDFSSAGADERIRFKTMSNMMKALATKHHITVLSTVEYTKLERGVKPSNNNIGETGQIDYDANFICHLYNDVHEFQDQATHYHLEVDEAEGITKRMPRVEAIIGKNKVSEFKGSIWFDFFPASSDFAYVDPTVVEEEEKEAKERKKKRKGEANGGVELI